MVTPERVPLGVFDAWNWARDPQAFGTDRGQRPIEEKESIRWLEGYHSILKFLVLDRVIQDVVRLGYLSSSRLIFQGWGGFKPPQVSTY
jgi:hypothetical protein